MNKNKLKNILAGVQYFDSKLGDSFKSVEKEIKGVADKLKADKELKTVESMKSQIGSILESMLATLGKLKDELTQNEQGIVETLNRKLDQLRTASAQFRDADGEKIKTLSEEIVQLKGDIKDLSQRKIEIPDFNAQIQKAKQEVDNMIITLRKESEKEFKENETDFEKKLEELKKDIADIRRRTVAQGGFQGGGQANRNILVGSNSSTLSRYTDLNIKAGSNITLTYTNNDNLKTTDLTIAGSGSGGGTVRTIATTAVSSVIGAVAATDYVVIASAGVKITLPAAASNTNLYTVKNTSTSSVLVVPNGAETIDGSANIIMPVQYTSIDLISDNTNWQLT